MIKRLVFVCVFSILWSLILFSQDSELGSEVYPFKKEISFDLKLHTNGYFALAFNKGIIKSPKRTIFYQAEIGAIKHRKETKYDEFGSVPQLSTSGRYIYGKQNSLYNLRAAIGEKRFFSIKQNDRGLGLGISYSAGVNLGILKPYFLEIGLKDTEGNVFRTITAYNEDIHYQFLDVLNIYGAGGFKYGWDDISLLPGLNAKLGLHLDWGTDDEFIKGLEFGFMFDSYFKKVPIMIVDDNQAAFMNVYILLQFGKRS